MQSKQLYDLKPTFAQSVRLSEPHMKMLKSLKADRGISQSNAIRRGIELVTQENADGVKTVRTTKGAGN